MPNHQLLLSVVLMLLARFVMKSKTARTIFWAALRMQFLEAHLFAAVIPHCSNPAPHFQKTTPSVACVWPLVTTLKPAIFSMGLGTILNAYTPKNVKIAPDSV